MIEVVRYDTNHDTIRQSAENAKAATYSSSAISIGATLSSPSQTVTTHLPYAYRLHPRPPRSSCTTEASRGSVSESRAPSSSSLKRDSRRPAMPRARPRMREARAPASAPMQALTRTQTHPTAPTSYPHLTPLHPHIPHTPPHPHLTAPTPHRTHTPQLLRRPQSQAPPPRYSIIQSQRLALLAAAPLALLIAALLTALLIALLKAALLIAALLIALLAVIALLSGGCYI